MSVRERVAHLKARSEALRTKLGALEARILGYTKSDETADEFLSEVLLQIHAALSDLNQRQLELENTKLQELDDALRSGVHLR